MECGGTEDEYVGGGRAGRDHDGGIVNVPKTTWIMNELEMASLCEDKDAVAENLKSVRRCTAARVVFSLLRIWSWSNSNFYTQHRRPNTRVATLTDTTENEISSGPLLRHHIRQTRCRRTLRRHIDTVGATDGEPLSGTQSRRAGLCKQWQSIWNLQRGRVCLAAGLGSRRQEVFECCETNQHARKGGAGKDGYDNACEKYIAIVAPRVGLE